MAFSGKSSLTAKRRKAIRLSDAATWRGAEAARVAKKRAAERLARTGNKTAKARLCVDLADPAATGTRKLKFGRVVVSGTAPDADTVRSNVDAGRQALRRATEVLVKPGVTLRLADGVPRFRADATRPGMLVRELNGAVQHGRIVDGAFVPAD